MAEAYSRARHDLEDFRSSVARTTNEAVRLFGEMARIVLDPAVRDAQLRHAIYRRIPATQLQMAVEESTRIVRPDEDAGFDFLRKRYGHLYRLDFILEAEGDTTNRYKLAKQPDVLMLFFLFSAEELQALFDRLGYPWAYETIPRNVDYYLKRSAHDSTLSRVADAWVLARADRPRSWDVFMEALATDVADIQGGTTAEGIHLGAMAGTVDVLQRCYTGLELRGEVLWLNPRLPKPMRWLHLFVRYRGHSLALDITHDRLRVSAERCAAPSMKIGLRNRVFELAASEVKEFSLP